MWPKKISISLQLDFLLPLWNAPFMTCKLQEPIFNRERSLFSFSSWTTKCKNFKFTVGPSNDICKILLRFNSATLSQKLLYKSSALKCPRKTEVSNFYFQQFVNQILDNYKTMEHHKLVF